MNKKKLLDIRDGATWFKATKFGDEKDRVVVRENGATTYFASDIAYHLEKRRRGFDVLLDVLGADHHGYIARVRAGLEAMGEPGAPYDQGYNDELDESLGMRHRGPHSQSMKDRRDESKGMEKAMGNRPYSGVGTMDVMEAEGKGMINMTNGAILVGATIVGALVANFFSKKGETEVSEEAGSVKEDKGNGQ